MAARLGGAPVFLSDGPGVRISFSPQPLAPFKPFAAEPSRAAEPAKLSVPPTDDKTALIERMAAL